MVLDRCIIQSSNFSPNELARMIRWTGKMQLREMKFTLAMAKTVVAKQEDMTIPQLCWVVWGLAKVNHEYPIEAFSSLADRISDKMEVSRVAHLLISHFCNRLLC